VLAFAIGLDVAIWALVWMATALVSRPSTVSATISRASDLVLPDGVTEKDLEDLRKLLIRVARPVTNNELASMLNVSKGEASKRVSAAVSAELCQRRRIGREVAITLH
jgi:predicted transcriptional regulator